MCFFRKGDAPSERGMTLWIVTGSFAAIAAQDDGSMFRMTRLLFRMTMFTSATSSRRRARLAGVPSRCRCFGQSRIA